MLGLRILAANTPTVHRNHAIEIKHTQIKKDIFKMVLKKETKHKLIYNWACTNS